MLWRALKHVEHGFYVDIGANDPVVDSVSKAFYDRGWRGVHVEPVAEYARLLREARPDDEVIEKAVGAETGEMILHVIPGTGLSSLVEASALSAVALRGYEHAEMAVPVITLDELLAPFSGRDIHWLKIDVEGAELDVLRGWNTKRDRPWIMVSEATLPNSQEECHQAWEPILLASGYQFVYFDGLSRFYVAEEHRELASSFRTPPNYFDGFVRADLAAAIAERDENARQCAELRKRLKELDIMQQRLIASEELSLKRHHLLEQAGRDMAALTPQLQQARAESASREADVAELTVQLGRARAESASREADVAELTVQLGRARAESASREADVAEMAAQLGQAHAELGRRQADVAEMAAQLGQAHAELGRRQADVAALTAQCDAMLNSASWRLTAPIRALKRIISRH